MQLKNLSLCNFKSFESFETELCDRINCFVGNNAIGKTNILESIYYLSSCKSFLNLRDVQNIKTGENFFIIKGDFLKNEETDSIYCGVQQTNKKKIFKKNNIEYKKLSEHIGLFPIIYSTPYDTTLLHGNSETRRKYIDSIISQFDKTYLINLINYNNALEQRNKLLKIFAKQKFVDKESLEIWDMQLARFGTFLYKARLKFSEEFSVFFQKYYNLISQEKEHVNLIYKSQLANENFENILQRNFEKDCILTYTYSGIHKDDFDFLLEDNLIKSFGSQGQQKTYTISLKFAQFDYIKKNTNIIPILMLDDIFDKLDRSRVKIITDLVSTNNFGQIFITDTSYDRLSEILKDLNVDYQITNL